MDRILERKSSCQCLLCWPAVFVVRLVQARPALEWVTEENGEGTRYTREPESGSLQVTRNSGCATSRAGFCASHGAYTGSVMPGCEESDSVFD